MSEFTVTFQDGQTERHVGAKASFSTDLAGVLTIEDAEGGRTVVSPLAWRSVQVPPKR